MRRRIRPSPAKKPLAPPNFVSTLIDSAEARYDPDWTMIVSPAISRAITSPDKVGAKSTSPGPPSARNVFMKNDSPPRTDRLIDRMKPPCAAVSVVTPGDIPTITPDSALTDSPGDSVTRANEYDGR